MIPSTAMMDSYHQTSLLTRPEGKRLTKLEQEMANILGRTDISEAQKLELFGITLENFKRVRGEIINNGLMLTPVNAPQSEITSEEIFKKLQDVIQQAISGGGPPSASKSVTIKPAPPSIPQAPPLAPGPAVQKKVFSAQAGKLHNQLLRSANIKMDPSTSKFILGGKKYSEDIFKEALSKITSNDDYNNTDPQIHSLTQNIYKALLKSSQDLAPLAKKHGYFQQLMNNTPVTPRYQKIVAKLIISGTPQQKTGTRRARKTSLSRKNDSRRIKSLTDLTGGGLVNFNAWDHLNEFVDLSDIDID